MNRTDVWPILSSALDIASAYRGRKDPDTRRSLMSLTVYTTGLTRDPQFANNNNNNNNNIANAVTTKSFLLHIEPRSDGKFTVYEESDVFPETIMTKTALIRFLKKASIQSVELSSYVDGSHDYITIYTCWRGKNCRANYAARVIQAAFRKFNKPRKNITRARAQLITAGAPRGITNAFTPRRKN